MKRKLLPLISLLLSAVFQVCYAQSDIKAIQALLERVVPDHFDQFEVEFIATGAGKDVFEIESKDKKIFLRGPDGVSIASALNYYLKNFHQADISWNSVNLKLPEKLSTVPEKIVRNSPYDYRYYLNYTTFNYTTTWWDWDRWEKEIDWMALNGINMPLAILGQNSIWQRVYKEMGFSDDDLNEFFSGPAYSAFNWMGLLDGYGGPLPQNWIDGQEDLQKKILSRQRSLGMTPILPAFTGHVPPGFKEKFPEAAVQEVQWTIFPTVNILDPNDPLFIDIGSRFIAEQRETFGTDHLYTADPFIEVVPPSNDSIYLSDMSQNIYQSMAMADPEAKWIMQGWMFYFLEEFWGDTQIQALLHGVPDENMIMLDLWSEVRPIWRKSEAYYGKPWLWCMVHNFGGNNIMFGKMPTIAEEPAKALNHPESGKLSGIGLTMEGIEQNPAVYELMLENTWRTTPIDLEEWISDYIGRRYGKENEHAEKAWTVLRNTVYGYGGDINSGGPRSMITMRPTFARQGVRTDVHSFYDPEHLLPAWEHMIKASNALKDSEGFQYDITEISRQILANYADELHKKYVAAYQDKQLEESRQYSKKFITVIDDMDRLVGTQDNFLLGTWLEDAKRWGQNKEERELYEFNARNILTMWHGKMGKQLSDYGWRHWSGLLKNFYKQRWVSFFEYAESKLKDDKEPDIQQFQETLMDWEWEWVNGHETYTTMTEGNSIAIAGELFEKYFKSIQEEYSNKSTDKTKDVLPGPEY